MGVEAVDRAALTKLSLNELINRLVQKIEECNEALEAQEMLSTELSHAEDDLDDANQQILDLQVDLDKATVFLKTANLRIKELEDMTISKTGDRSSHSHDNPNLDNADTLHARLRQYQTAIDDLCKKLESVSNEKSLIKSVGKAEFKNKNATKTDNESSFFGSFNVPTLSSLTSAFEDEKHDVNELSSSEFDFPESNVVKVLQMQRDEANAATAIANAQLAAIQEELHLLKETLKRAAVAPIVPVKETSTPINSSDFKFSKDSTSVDYGLLASKSEEDARTFRNALEDASHAIHLNSQESIEALEKIRDDIEHEYAQELGTVRSNCERVVAIYSDALAVAAKKVEEAELGLVSTEAGKRRKADMSRQRLRIAVDIKRLTSQNEQQQQTIKRLEADLSTTRSHLEALLPICNKQSANHTDREYSTALEQRLFEMTDIVQHERDENQRMQKRLREVFGVPENSSNKGLSDRELAQMGVALGQSKIEKLSEELERAADMLTETTVVKNELMSRIEELTWTLTDMEEDAELNRAEIRELTSRIAIYESDGNNVAPRERISNRGQSDASLDADQVARLSKKIGQQAAQLNAARESALFKEKETDRISEELASLQSMLEDCEATIVQKTDQCERQMTELTTLRPLSEEVSSLRSQVSIFTECNTSLAAAKDILSSDMESLLSRFGELEKDYDETLDQLEDAEARRDQTIDQMRSTEAKFNEQFAVIEKLEARLRAEFCEAMMKDAKYKDLLAEKERLNNTIAENNKTISNLTEVVGEHEIVMNNLRLDSVEKSAKMRESLQNEINNLHEKITEMSDLLDETIMEKEDLSAQCKDLEEFAALGRDYDDLNQVCVMKDSTISKLTSDIKELRRTIKELESSGIEGKSVEFLRKIEGQEAVIAYHLETIANLERSLMVSQEKNNEVELKNTELINKLKDTRAASREVNQFISGLQTQVETLAKRSSDLMQDRVRLVSVMDEDKATIVQQAQTLDELQSKNRSLMEQNNILRTELSLLQDQDPPIKHLPDTAAAVLVSATRDKTMEMYSSTVKEKQALVAMVQSQREMIDGLERDISTLREHAKTTNIDKSTLDRELRSVVIRARKLEDAYRNVLEKSRINNPQLFPRGLDSSSVARDAKVANESALSSSDLVIQLGSYLESLELETQSLECAVGSSVKDENNPSPVVRISVEPELKSLAPVTQPYLNEIKKTLYDQARMDIEAEKSKDHNKLTAVKDISERNALEIALERLSNEKFELERNIQNLISEKQSSAEIIVRLIRSVERGAIESEECLEAAKTAELKWFVLEKDLRSEIDAVDMARGIAVNDLQAARRQCRGLEEDRRRSAIRISDLEKRLQLFENNDGNDSFKKLNSENIARLEDMLNNERQRRETIELELEEFRNRRDIVVEPEIPESLRSQPSNDNKMDVISILKNELEDCKQAYLNSTIQLELRNSDVITAKAESESFRRDILSISDELDVTKMEVNRLKSSNLELVKVKNDLSMRLDNNLGTIEALQKSNDDLTFQKDSLSVKANEDYHNAINLKGQLDDLHIKYDSLKSEKTVAESNLIASEGVKRALEAALGKSEHTNNELLMRLQSVNNLDVRLKEVIAERDALSAKLLDSNRLSQGRQDDLKIVESSAKSLARERESIRSEYAAASADREKLILELETRLASFQESNSLEELDELRLEVEFLRSRVTELEKTDRKREKDDASSVALKELEKENRKLRVSIETMSLENDQLKRDKTHTDDAELSNVVASMYLLKGKKSSIKKRWGDCMRNAILKRIVSCSFSKWKQSLVSNRYDLVDQVQALKIALQESVAGESFLNKDKVTSLRQAEAQTSFLEARLSDAENDLREALLSVTDYKARVLAAETSLAEILQNKDESKQQLFTLSEQLQAIASFDPSTSTFSIGDNRFPVSPRTPRVPGVNVGLESEEMTRIIDLERLCEQMSWEAMEMKAQILVYEEEKEELQEKLEMAQKNQRQ